MKIAFIGNSTNTTPFSEFAPLAKYLTEEAVMDCFTVLEPNANPLIRKFVSTSKLRCYINDIEMKIGNPGMHQPSFSTRRSRSARQARKSIGFARQVYYGLRAFKDQYRLNRIIKGIFDREKPDAIFIFGDRGVRLTGSAIQYGVRNNIPLINLQMAVSSIEFLARNRMNRRQFDANYLPNRIMAAYFPEHVKEIDGQRLMFYTWYCMIALLGLKMMARNPWHNGESFPVYNLLLSEGLRNKAIAEGGVCPNSWIVGQLSLDNLYQIYQNRSLIKCEMLQKYFGSEANLEYEVCVFALPQWAEHDLMPAEKAVDEMRYLLETLAQEDRLYVLLSLHPKMDYITYAHFNDICPHIQLVRDERLSHFLPIANYSLNAFPSTLQWSVLCGQHAIYLNYYNMGYGQNPIPACVSFNNKHTFKEDFRELRQRNPRESVRDETLPPFDGQCGKRILDHIFSLVEFNQSIETADYAHPIR